MRNWGLEGSLNLWCILSLLVIDGYWPQCGSPQSIMCEAQNYSLAPPQKKSSFGSHLFHIYEDESLHQ